MTAPRDDDGLDELMRRARAGDPVALAAVTEISFTTSRRIAERMLHGDTATAEDVAQEVTVSVFHHLHEIKKLIPWVGKATRSRVINIWRSRLRQSRLLAHHAATVCHDAPAASFEPRLKAALDALPPEQLEVLVLRYVAGLSCPEIAVLLGIPLGTVFSRLRLAFRRLREILEIDVVDSEDP